LKFWENRVLSCRWWAKVECKIRTKTENIYGPEKQECHTMPNFDQHDNPYDDVDVEHPFEDDPVSFARHPRTTNRRRGRRKAVSGSSRKRGAHHHATKRRLGRMLSIDVECVAGSRHHLDVEKYPESRIPATVCVVDNHNQVLVDAIIAIPKERIVSYLEPLTGLNEDSFKTALPLDTVLAQVYACCDEHTVIVGQNPVGDLAWLRLKQGTHYSAVIDISDFYKVWNKRYKSFSKYSLQNTAMALLGTDMSGPHSAKKDAMAAMALYHLWNAAGKTKGEQRQLKNRLRRARFPDSVVKQFRYCIDGVCMSQSPKWCSCGGL